MKSTSNAAGDAATVTAHAWPADQIERRKVDDLVPYARNSRTHSPQQVSQIAASIKEWGWTTPVLVDEGGMIIAGHGRVMAAQKLGIVEIPVMVTRGWSEAQKRAYVIADNKLALNAGWDMEALKVEMADLEQLGFDLSMTGFDTGELTTLLGDQSVDISVGEDEAASGTDGAYLAFGKTKIPISDAEKEGLERVLRRYVDEYSLNHGFAGWLVEQVEGA